MEDIWARHPEASPHVKQADESTFSSHVKCLNTFRATLPQVRRALANTPTYMIGDDHDITDDWYLDGAWCQRVIASPLGKRIIRNALLAMAMFQAWGNTPDLFETPSGQAFLHALDRWHGEEEDACIQQLNKAIDRPHHFGGYGELPHHEQALHWHYAFSGPTYQIIAMDTRTHRLYREPEAFPGLLAPDAMRHQVQANQRDDVLATIIISPVPDPFEYHSQSYVLSLLVGNSPIDKGATKPRGDCTARARLEQKRFSFIPAESQLPDELPA